MITVANDEDEDMRVDVPPPVIVVDGPVRKEEKGEKEESVIEKSRESVMSE